MINSHIDGGPYLPLYGLVEFMSDLAELGLVQLIQNDDTEQEPETKELHRQIYINEVFNIFMTVSDT